ncbi:hypothetical protein ACNO8S_10260 [Haloarcula sp. KBTZ06]|uniref:hypothetical protein n=1 Tax=unclassified Haloarcula TaxID=2624677 RepID=UPI001244EC56|nr:hypothetical protein [Haloarcula sp. CBA1131]KAA9406597.1 hypothetical protein Har1131_07160 [Haloarcula sp. CBA1131]
MEIDVDSDLREKLSARAKRYGFDSGEEYASTILHIVISELEGTEAEDDDLEDRLEDLGYL